MKQKGIKPFFRVPAFNETPLFLGSIWVSAVPLLLPKLNLTLLTVVVARFSEMDLNTYPCNHKAAVLYPSGPNHCFRTTQKCQVTSSSLKPLYLCCFFSIACIEKVGTNSYEFYPGFQKELKNLNLFPIPRIFFDTACCFAAMSSLWDVDGSTHHQSRSLSAATGNLSAHFKPQFADGCWHISWPQLDRASGGEGHLLFMICDHQRIWDIKKQLMRDW